MCTNIANVFTKHAEQRYMHNPDVFGYLQFADALKMESTCRNVFWLSRFVLAQLYQAEASMDSMPEQCVSCDALVLPFNTPLDQGFLFSSIAYGVPLSEMSKASLELACKSCSFYAALAFARAFGYKVFSKCFLLAQVQYLIHPDFGNGAFTSNFAELLNPRICSISNACNASALQQAFEYVDLAIHARHEARPEQQLAHVVG